MLTLVVLIVFMPFSHCAKILAILPTPSYSHQIAYSELWKELSLRGHKVTLITTNPINDANLTNLTEIDMKDSYTLNKEISKIAENEVNAWNVHEAMLQLVLKIIELQLSHPQVQELIDGKHNFDVVLVKFLYPEFLIFGKIYNCPTILISSYDLQTYFYQIMGNPSHPISHPDMILPFHKTRNLKERMLSTIYNLYVWYWRVYKEFPEKERIISKYFNNSVSIEELIKDVDMVFVNSHPAIHVARALGPTTINIGYHRKPVSPNSLEKGLKDFMDSAQDGFIYFSLGSNVKSSEINKNLLKTIIDSLHQVPYKVLYKYEADDLTDVPHNVKLIKWAPQDDVLRHPNIKLFITQGGTQSMEGAIYNAVPMVVIPFFMDQEHNAKLLESKGVAKIVDRKSLKKEDLTNAILEVINNSSYRKSIENLRQLALDVPVTGLEKAIWWTEYVIRNKGAKHLRNPVADLPSYQYFLLDVIGFFVLAFITCFIVVYILLRKLLKIIVLFKVKKD